MFYLTYLLIGMLFVITINQKSPGGIAGQMQAVGDIEEDQFKAVYIISIITMLIMWPILLAYHWNMGGR